MSHVTGLVISWLAVLLSLGGIGWCIHLFQGVRGSLKNNTVLLERVELLCRKVEQHEEQYDARLAEERKAPAQNDQRLREELNHKETEIAQITTRFEQCDSEVKRLEGRLGESARIQSDLQAENSEMQSRLQSTLEAQSSLEHRCTQFETEISKLREYPAALQALRECADGLPVALHEYVVGLLQIADQMENRDLSALTSGQGMESLDQFLYRAPQPYGLLSNQNDDALDLQTLIQITALQGLLHDRLQELGLYVINPGIGDEFNPEWYRCSDTDLVWINDDPSRHNRVAGVKRIGYRFRERVLRKAETKRFLVSNAREGAGSPRIPMQTEDQGVREGALSMPHKTTPQAEGETERMPKPVVDTPESAPNETVLRLPRQESGEPATDSSATEEDLLAQTLRGNIDPR